MIDPTLGKILIFTDETVGAQRSMENLLAGVFAPMGYEVHTYDLHHVRESGIKMEEIIDLVKPQTVLWQLSLPFEQRLKEFLDAEELKPIETRFIPPEGGTVPRFILLSPVDEHLIDRTLKRQFGDYRKREIVMMPFSIDGLIRIVSGEGTVECEPTEIQLGKGKERE